MTILLEPNPALSSDTEPFRVETVSRLVFPAAANPAVSIVIPVYNNWHYTYHCLKSLLTRTTGIEYEVIISDDGSTDETARMLEKVEGVEVVADGRKQRFCRGLQQWSAVSAGKIHSLSQ